jgi:hypothetical protein
MIKISYSGYRFPAEIIQHAIWLYVRFAAAWPRISKISFAMAWRSSVSPPSASCYESFVLTYELSGPALIEMA